MLENYWNFPSNRWMHWVLKLPSPVRKPLETRPTTLPLFKPRNLRMKSLLARARPFLRRLRKRITLAICLTK